MILFDGVCGFCSRTVRFVIRKDSNQRYLVAPLQSSVARDILRNLDLSTNDMDTLIFVEGGRCSTKSTAVLKILRQLDGYWSYAYPLVLVSRPLRDLCYDFFARRRYRWFGKADHCFTPTPEERARVLA